MVKSSKRSGSRGSSPRQTAAPAVLSTSNPTLCSSFTWIWIDSIKWASFWLFTRKQLGMIGVTTQSRQGELGPADAVLKWRWGLQRRKR